MRKAFKIDWFSIEVLLFSKYIQHLGFFSHVKTNIPSTLGLYHHTSKNILQRLFRITHCMQQMMDLYPMTNCDQMNTKIVVK
jgi:hypothetical protein